MYQLKSCSAPFSGIKVTLQKEGRKRRVRNIDMIGRSGDQVTWLLYIETGLNVIETLFLILFLVSLVFIYYSQISWLIFNHQIYFPSLTHKQHVFLL
jgi:hypothetical protein